MTLPVATIGERMIVEVVPVTCPRSECGKTFYVKSEHDLPSPSFPCACCWKAAARPIPGHDEYVAVEGDA